MKPIEKESNAFQCLNFGRFSVLNRDSSRIKLLRTLKQPYLGKTLQIYVILSKIWGQVEMSRNKSLKQKLPLIFTTYFGNRSCMSCPNLPLCPHFSYKEIAIIQLFYQQMIQNTKRFFSLTEFHEIFLKNYVYERDGYTTFYNIINYLTTEEGILLKLELLNPKNTFMQNIHGYKKNSVLYSLNPAYSSQFFLDMKNFFDFRYTKTICPIGMNTLCFQILEALIQKDGQTIDQIKKSISKDIFKNTNRKKHKQTFRRIITEMCAINVILPEESSKIGEPLKYFSNQAHYLLNKSVT